MIVDYYLYDRIKPLSMGRKWNLVMARAILDLDIDDVFNNPNMDNEEKRIKLKDLFKKMDYIDIVMRDYRDLKFCSEEKTNIGR